MNIHARRILARAGIGAAALLAAGAFAAPAYADDTADLGLNVTGTTIATGVSGKIGDATVTNNGPSAATGVKIVFDTTGLNASLVEFPLPSTEACADNSGVITCGVEPVPSGANIDLGFSIKLKAGANGAAGQLKVSVQHAGTDPVEDNNSKTVDITVTGTGADLGVVAYDVYQVDENGDYLDKPVVPGTTSLLWVYVENQGNAAANGVKLTVKLPEHATFTEAEPDCSHAVGDATTTCEYDTALVPADEDEGDDVTSFGWFFWEIKVAGDTPSPSTLTGGVATADAISVEQSVPSTARVARPSNFTTEAPDEELKDVDPTDNTDEYSVFVAKEPAGSLPITGARAGLIGGAGAAVLVAGGLMFLVARRRRVVMVTPTDG